MHILEALIAKAEVVKDIEDRFVLAKCIPLSQGYSMVPITDALKGDVDELVGKTAVLDDCFAKLSGSIADVVLESRRPYEIAYIESECFGGVSEQSAMVWKDGEIIYGPMSSCTAESPINEALKAIGVRVIRKQDEFDELNLGWNRDTESWFTSGS